jgi:cbb3-type cytochrome oxidase maturation protein
MEVIYTLIPGMIFFGLVFVAVLFYAIKKGQYDDLEGDAHRILLDEDDPDRDSGEARKQVGLNYPDQDD